MYVCVCACVSVCHSHSLADFSLFSPSNIFPLILSQYQARIYLCYTEHFRDSFLPQINNNLKDRKDMTLRTTEKRTLKGPSMVNGSSPDGYFTNTADTCWGYLRSAKEAHRVCACLILKIMIILRSLCLSLSPALSLSLSLSSPH